MKLKKLKQRLDRNRPMTGVALRMPKDVVEDLKKVAPIIRLFRLSAINACLYWSRFAC
jgi:hypothetical protein